MGKKMIFQVFLTVLCFCAVMGFADPDVVVTQVTIPTVLPVTQVTFPATQSDMAIIQSDPIQVIPEATLPVIPVEPYWSVFPAFDIEFELLTTMRTAEGFFSEDAYEARIQQNMLPLSAIKTLYTISKSGATPTFESLVADSGQVISGDAALSLIANTDFHAGFAVDNFVYGVYTKLDVDSLFVLPSWMFEAVNGGIPSGNSEYTFSGSILDINASAGLFAGLKLDLVQIAVEVGRYIPVITTNFNTNSVCVSNGVTYSGTTTVDGILYSSLNPGALGIFDVPTALINSGGWKGDISVLFGEEKTLAGISVSNIPFTSAQVNYIAPWDLNFYAASGATPTSNMTQNLTWTAASQTYRIRPVYAGFVNVPLGDSGYFQFHCKLRPFSGTDVGGMFTFFIGDGFSLLGDLTYNTTGFYYYSFGMGFYGEKSRFNIDIGVGSQNFFDYKTLTSPRISISSDFVY
jgi:hypothetical protein